MGSSSNRAIANGVIYPVNQLYPDPELGPLKHDHKLTMIFFHGFSNDTYAWKNTWIQRDNRDVIWPRNWLWKDDQKGGLGEDILVLSMSYDAGPKGAHEHVWEIGKNLVQSLINDTRWQLQRPQTIVLVGYSFGGLVIKSLAVEVDRATKERCQSAIETQRRDSSIAFQQNLKGIVFYSVPHTGANKDFEKFVTDWNKVPFLKGNSRLNGLMRSLKEFNREMVQLSTDFGYAVSKDINLQAIVEGRQVVVPVGSARQLARNNVVKIEDANHLQVCQPEDPRHPSYQALLQFTKTVLSANMTPELKQSQGIKVS